MSEPRALLYLLKMGPGSLFGAFPTLFAYAALRVLSLSGRG